jgi:hypothetical protein
MRSFVVLMKRNKIESPITTLTSNQGVNRRFEMENHKIVSREEWLAARKQHSIKEKEFPSCALN